MKLATTTGDFGAYTTTQQESMRLIAQTDFKYLDYNFGVDFNRKNGAYSADLDAHVADILRTADELGFTFVQSHAPMGKPLADESGEFAEATIRSIEAAGKLGIPSIVVHSGYLPKISKEECFELNKKFYEKLFPTAEKYGVNILIENFNKMSVPDMYWIDNAADQRALIDLVDHPLFHACWDTGHGNMQETPQHEALAMLGSHVMAIHVQDNYGNTDAHMAPFFGTLSLDSLITGLKNIGYKGYFTFESGNILLPAKSRRKFDGEEKLATPPAELRVKAEQFLYEIGKCALSAYDMFEE